MTLNNLAGICIARSNLTFRLLGAAGEDGGTAERSDPKLIKAVYKLTSVRKKSAGKVVVMLNKISRQTWRRRASKEIDERWL